MRRHAQRNLAWPSGGLCRTCRDSCSGWWCGSFGHEFGLVHESTPTGMPVMMVYSSHGTPSLRMRTLGLAAACRRCPA